MAREQAASEARITVAEARAASEAEVARLQAVEKSANERIANLTSILKVLERAQYGKRSERLRLTINDEQAAFAFEEVETGLSAIRSELDRAVGNKPKRAPRPRKGFAAHLERVEEVVEPEIPVDCEELEKVLIGEDRSERLDVVPPKFRVIVTRRPKYAFRGRDGVIQALAPAHIIESGLPTERLLAYIAVSKYADGLPLYRQEAIYLRDGVEVKRHALVDTDGRALLVEAYAHLVPAIRRTKQQRPVRRADPSSTVMKTRTRGMDLHRKYLPGHPKARKTLKTRRSL
jgi:transposase